LEQILKESPEHIDSLLKMGSIKSHAREYSAAFNYYKRAYSIDPSRPETLFALADVKEASGAYPDALVYVDEILEMYEDNVRALYRKRELLEKMEKWDDIVYLQRKIIKMKKSDKGRAREQEKLLGYKYEQGRYSLENGEFEKAQKTFQTVLRLDKKFIPAHLGLAEVMLREGNADDAVNYLENGYLQTRSLIVLARIEDMLINLDEPGRLISIYRTALLKEPDSVPLKLMLGKLYHRLEMLDDALEVLQSIDYSGTGSPEIAKILGNIYLKRHEPQKAAQQFKKAIDMRRAFRVPYCCAICGFFAVDWAGRCPSCKNWNTYQFDISDSCRIALV
ncbi:MAG: tetratricopeptide repeat protein, partial [bacterium]